MDCVQQVHPCASDINKCIDKWIGCKLRTTLNWNYQVRINDHRHLGTCILLPLPRRTISKLNMQIIAI